MRGLLLEVYQWICDRVLDLEVGLRARYLNRRLGRQIDVWSPNQRLKLKSTSGSSNRRLGAQIDVSGLKSTSGSANQRMGA